MHKIIELVTKQWTLDDLHGLPHWQRVERNAMLLVTADVNPRVVRLFAYFHDACRLDNDSDTLHGFRAKCLVDSLRTSLLKELSNEEFHQLKTACELHTTTLSVGDPTIDTCFDADRLDLERCGILPDPQRMATAQGKYFAHNRHCPINCVNGNAGLLIRIIFSLILNHLNYGQYAKRYKSGSERAAE